jgi:hypothetical protein
MPNRKDLDCGGNPALRERRRSLENGLDNRTRHAIESAVAAALCRRSPRTITTPAIFSRSAKDFNVAVVSGRNHRVI